MKEKEIQKYMNALGISREEAEQLWNDDHEDVVTPEMAEMEAKAKKIKRYEKSDTPRKKTERVRKVDEEKAEILDLLIKGYTKKYPRMVKVKNETEFSFTHNGNAYTVKLIKHRAPK